MTERVRDLGGSMEIVSAPGCGTRVRLSLPLEHTATIR
jgi:signal transduction histidine kinase